jgi:sporulation delaying protein A
MPHRLARSKDQVADPKSNGKVQTIASVRVTFGVTLGLTCLLLAVTVGASWPANVLDDGSTGHSTKANLQVVMPQAWAFFTRSPEDPSLVPYLKGVRVDTLPQSSVVNLFGLTRNQRSQGTELALIANQIPKFTACHNYLNECLSRPADTTYEFSNPTTAPFFCGTMRIVVQTPVRWSFRTQTPESVRVTEYADVDLSCRFMK